MPARDAPKAALRRVWRRAGQPASERERAMMAGCEGRNSQLPDHGGLEATLCNPFISSRFGPCGVHAGPKFVYKYRTDLWAAR